MQVFRSSFASSGPGEGQLNHPKGIATDAAGNIWVADTENNRIEKFSPEGKFLLQFGSSGSSDGQLSKPRGVVIDSTGNVWVADTGNNRVQKFSAAGKFISKFGSFGSENGKLKSPSGIAIDSGGNVWVADTGNNRVQKFSAAGVYQTAYTALKGPTGIAASGNAVAIADTENNRVVMLSGISSPPTLIGTITGLNHPEGVAWGGNGQLWIADTGNHHVGRMVEGKFVGFGSQGGGEEQLESPAAVAVDSSGYIWVADTGNARVQEWITATAHLGFRSSFGSSGPGEGQLNKPRGIAIDAAGNVWIADTENNRIEKFSPEGKFLFQFGSSGSNDGQLNKLRGIAIDSAGNLWVADTGNNRVQKFSAEGKFISKFGSFGSENGKLKSPSGIAIDSTGNLWVADTGNNRVQKFSAAGVYQTAYTALSGPTGISISGGSVAVADTGNNRIVWLSGISSPPTLLLTQSGGLKQPEGVAWGAPGQLWIADTGNHRIGSFVEGKFAGFGTQGSGEEQFEGPAAIAVDAGGNYWVADTGNARVQRWNYAVPPLLAMTKPASEVTGSQALLQARIEPMGLDAHYYFEYGKTTAYGTKAPVPSADAGVPIAEVGQLIEGLSPSRYHFRVVATNSEGTARGADEVFTSVDTTITSRTPSYTNHETWPVEFTSNAPGSTFKCTFDGTAIGCASPYELELHLGTGWHTFTVAATSPEGITDPTPASWTFDTGAYAKAPSTSKLVYPEDGKKTASYYTLQAEWGAAPSGGGVTGVSFQMKLPKWDAFKTIPTECVIDGKGQQVSWPLAATANPGHSEPVFLGVRDCGVFSAAGYPEAEIQFRAVFDGGINAAGASAPATTEFIRNYNANRISTDATESVGPGTVDLLTGALTIRRTDVSIPVPGTDATLEFSRVYDSTIANTLPGFSTVLGSWWQPSSPVEAEFEGEAWVKLEEQVIPAQEAVTKRECWNAEEETVDCGTVCDSFCEEWSVEEAQPEQRWIELVSSDGSVIPFEIAGESYVAPDYAKELSLKREDAEHIVLADPNGTHTTFTKNGTTDYLPKAISFQATPNSVRMVYENIESHGLRLMREIAPAPQGVTCGDWTSHETAGCRTLKFEYSSKNKWAKGIYPSWMVNLDSIRYYDATGNAAGSQVVADYEYDDETRLIEEWDPRVSPNLEEKYSYRGSGSNDLASLTPPGQEPWEFAYYNQPGGPLRSVSRSSLLASPSNATTTIVYGVPLSGSDAPYDMSPSTVAQWGQADFPVDATAVFPPTQVPPGETVALRSSFGAVGSNDGQLDHPKGIATDAAGNIWVADTENSRIEKFSAEGKFISKFGSFGPSDGQLSKPRGIAIDPTGNIWVADTGNNRVQKFSAEGKFISKFGALGSETGKLKSPSGVAIDAGGNVWVADTGNNRVQKFSAGGVYQTAYTALKGPTGISASGNLIAVADTENNRVVMLVGITSPPTLLTTTTGLNHPEGVAWGGSGQLWIADTGNHRVGRMVEGKFVGFGSQGSGEEQLEGPAALAVDSSGYIWVADTGNSRVQQRVVETPPVSDYSKATIHYLDPDGQEVNTASPAPPGASGPSITTAETDMRGNVVRGLSAQNRLLALEAADPVARSRELDSHSVYSADGTQMLESWGPLHEVRLENGETVEARQHTTIKYDEGAPALKAGESAPRLPTKEITGAAVPGVSGDADQLVSEYRYNWTLRKQTESITDPGGLNIRSKSVYDSSGLPLEISQPKDVAAGSSGAGTTKFVYYSATATASEPSCGQVPQYAGLPCKVMPAAQPGTAGQPQLPVRTTVSYNSLAQPLEVTEAPPGGSVRKVKFTYDAAGRQLTKEITGGGVAIPKVETQYHEDLGVPVAQRFKCESECGNPQFLTSVGAASATQGAVKNPTDVAIAGNGDIWVVDQGNNRVVVYNEAGEFVREVGGLGSTGGKLSSPSAIAIDSVGTVDVTDTANNRVAQYNANGAFIQVIGANVNKTKVAAGGTAAEKNRCTAASGHVCQAGTAGTADGQISEPVGITTTGGQNFFVVERANNRVEKFSPQGEFLAKFGGSGSGDGQLKEPTAIGFYGFLLWVADTGNNRMEAFTTSYTYSRKFGATGSADGQLSKPSGVETDSSGNLWVSDQGNKRVQKFNETGGFLLKFGAGGTQEGQLSSPAGIGSDGKGNLFLADNGNNRVQKWSTSGFDTQETVVAYDGLGRPTEYKDADGNIAKTTYDYLGRPVSVNDGKGTQTARYDSVTGLLVELEDSAAGTFTASYDADGQMVKQGLPNGLTRQITVDGAGEATGLTYTKTSNCGTSCTWLSFAVERSVRGQIVLENGTLGKDEYAYDRAGRLVTARETLAGGSCTTRTYAFDKDSNRTEMKTIPAVAGACSSTGGTTRSYSYDSADRLLAPGLTYDDFGRITSLPGEFAGGKTLTTSYFSNDMVATQTQDGATNTFQLDAMLRHRQRLQAGGLQGTEVFHYAGPSDSPAWTERASSWTRSISGIGGELAALQESGKEVELQLANLHGDLSATAAVSPTVTALKASFSYDEFGTQTSGSTGRRFGWLGGKQRRTELKSGVIQMGVRSYIPQLGRFLTPDPVFGGSANPYDYANQDPVNLFDLTGECPKSRHSDPCGRGGRAATPKQLRRIAKREARAHGNPSAVVKSRKCTAIACRVGWPKGGGGSDPISDYIAGVANEAVDYLLNTKGLSGMTTKEIAQGIIDSLSTPAGKKAVGCAQASAAAWQESAGIRGSYPVGGLAASAVYTATRCVIGGAAG